SSGSSSSSSSSAMRSFSIVDLQLQIDNRKSLCLEHLFQFIHKPLALGHDRAVFDGGVFAEELLLPLVELLRHLDEHLHEFVAVAVGARSGRPLPLSLKTSPCWVPAGTSSSKGPASVGTSTFDPSAACVKLMGIWQTRSLLWRVKNGWALTAM